MTPTLLEGAIVAVLIWIAWRIGSILTPIILQRLRDKRAAAKTPPDRKDKPPVVIDT